MTDKRLQTILSSFVNLDSNINISTFISMKYANRLNDLVFDYLHLDLFYDVLFGVVKDISYDLSNHQNNMALGSDFAKALITYINQLYRFIDIKKSIVERATPLKLKYLNSPLFNDREKMIIKLGFDR